VSTGGSILVSAEVSGIIGDTIGSPSGTINCDFWRIDLDGG